MQYTSQIFLPECGFQNKLLNKLELVDILELPDRDVLKNEKVSLMDQIVDLFLQRKKGKLSMKADSSTQTEYGDSIMNLENKLQMIEIQYKEKMNQQVLPNAQSIEEKMLRYKRDLEQRMKAELEAEIVRIR